MTALPVGWAWASVGDIAADRTGITDGPFGSNLKTSHYTDSGPRVVRLQNIGDGAFIDAQAHISDEHFALLAKHAVEPGDVLVASLGESLPRACTAPLALGPAIVKADCIRVRPHESVDSEYVMWALNSPSTRASVSESIKGVGRPRVNLGDLRRLKLPIAPRVEQERVAAAIEEAFSKLDAGEAGLRTVRQLLKRMRDAVLTAAVTGRLVLQDPTDTPAAKLLADTGIQAATTTSALSCGWSAARLGDLARVGSGTTPSRKRIDYWDSKDVPWVTSGLLSDGVVWAADEFVSESAVRETSLKVWPAGTLLVAMYGEGQTRGRCAELAIDATCNQACAAIALPPGLASYRQFLRIFFDANYAAHRRLASGGVQPNLNGGIIKDMVVPVPPEAEQQRIVTELHRQFSFIEAAERAVDAGLARSAALRQSVLKAAFVGRLVPQDPSDEPASALLERIKASSAEPKPTKRRARGKP